MAEAILWKGLVSIRNNPFWVNSGYAEIYKEKIVIRKKEEANSEVIREVTRKNLRSVKFPEFGAMEALLTGYRGAILEYNDGTKDQKLMFWARGSFGAFPNEQEMGPFVKALAGFAGKEASSHEVVASAGTYSFTKYLLVLLPFIVGFYLSGILGGLVMGLCGLWAINISSKADMPKEKKILFIAGILGAALVVTLIIGVGMGIVVGILLGTE